MGWLLTHLLFVAMMYYFSTLNLSLTQYIIAIVGLACYGEFKNQDGRRQAYKEASGRVVDTAETIMNEYMFSLGLHKVTGLAKENPNEV